MADVNNPVPAPGGGLFLRMLAGVAVATLFLLALEGGLRFLPLDRWEQGRTNSSYPLFVPGTGTDDGYYVVNPHFAAVTRIARFPMVKPPGVRRIFILGGSAALGWPGTPETAFSGYLQRALDKVAPGRFEIINAAAVSYGSHRVRDLLNDVVGMEPDLVIVWSGNNEYVERNAFSRLARTETMSRLQRLLRHSALYRTVQITLGTVAPQLFARPEGGDITDLRTTPHVRRGTLGRTAETDRQVLENYRANLQGMAGLLGKQGVKGLFCTVPVNLSGWVPANVPPSFTDPAQEQAWQQVKAAAFAQWEQNRFGPAVSSLSELLRLTPRYAFAHYLLGDCYRNMGQIDQALREFEAARELDPRPVRALPAFDAAVREVAAAPGMGLVDLEGAFLKASGSNLSGLDLFLDYVHPNETGHKLAAEVLLPEIGRQLDPALPLERTAQLIGEDNWLADKHVNQAEMAYALGMTLSNNGNLAGAEQAYLKALAEDPGYVEPAGNLGGIYEHRGDLETALKYYRQAVGSDAGTIYNFHLARVLYKLGDRAGAREAGERLAKQGVVEAGLFRLLGDIAFEEGRWREAQGMYRQAVDAGDDSPELQIRMAEASRKPGG